MSSGYEHLQVWYEVERIVDAPGEWVDDLQTHLTSGQIPMANQFHFAWQLIDHRSATLGDDSLFWDLADCELLRYPRVLVASGTGKLSVHGGTHDLLLNLDTLLWKVGGPAYLCALTERGPVPEHFGIYDGVETIRCSVS